MNLDWLLVLPFFIAAIMSHLGHNFSADNYETGDKE